VCIQGAATHARRAHTPCLMEFISIYMCIQGVATLIMYIYTYADAGSGNTCEACTPGKAKAYAGVYMCFVYMCMHVCLCIYVCVACMHALLEIHHVSILRANMYIRYSRYTCVAACVAACVAVCVAACVAVYVAVCVAAVHVLHYA